MTIPLTCFALHFISFFIGRAIATLLSDCVLCKNAKVKCAVYDENSFPIWKIWAYTVQKLTYFYTPEIKLEHQKQEESVSGLRGMLMGSVNIVKR